MYQGLSFAGATGEAVCLKGVLVSAAPTIDPAPKHNPPPSSEFKADKPFSIAGEELLLCTNTFVVYILL